VDVGIDIRERGLRTDEILQILKRLWTEPVASFEGRFYSFKDVVFEPKPFQKPHPPIWVGGNTDAAMRRAARFGNGWAGSLENAAARVGSAKEALKRLGNYLEQHGRSRKDFHISTTLRAHIGPDRTKALEEAREFWALQRGSTEGNRPFELKESFAAYGPAEIAVEKIRELRELGLDSLMLYIHAFDLREQLRRIDEEVLPRVL
jgi:alkanesulfonate monooxygenase SsuD/methylene tetrahydromethanopterin reductase-like flavin-dependent oxidoreductase (luciferase family)